jgi:DNA-binding response OmpR family regulator
MRIAFHIRCDETYKEINTVLAHAGFDCVQFKEITTLMRLIDRQPFDLVLFDTEGTDENFLRAWVGCRADEKPLILMTPDWTGEQVAYAFDSGVEDVMRREIDPAEMVARVHAVLRRHYLIDGRDQAEINLRGYTLKRKGNVVLNRGTPVNITPREFSLAWILFSSPGVHLTRQTICAALWSADDEIAGHSVEQHVYQLRKKLGLTLERGAVIRAIYNRGYRFDLTAESNVAELKAA